MAVSVSLVFLSGPFDQKKRLPGGNFLCHSISQECIVGYSLYRQQQLNSTNAIRHGYQRHTVFIYHGNNNYDRHTLHSGGMPVNLV